MLTWRTGAKFEETDSIFNECDCMISHLPCEAASPVYLEVAECIQLAIARLVQTDINQDNDTFDLLQAACEVLAHLGSHGSSARTMLRSSGVVDLCFNSIAAIRTYAARRNDEKLGTDALASTVATLRRVSIVAGRADLSSLRGVPVVYDVLRSQLSRPSIQQQGLQLMHVLGRTCEGAKELDRIPGSWQWLGRTQFHQTRRGESYPWAVAQSVPQNAHIDVTQPQGWSATRLATFLNLRGLKQESCNELQRNVEHLRIMALLPFEGESSEGWRVRMEAFENRSHVNLFAGSMSVLKFQNSE